MSANQSKNLILNFTLHLDEKIYMSLDAEVLKDDIKMAICTSSVRGFAYKSGCCCYKNDGSKNLEKNIPYNNKFIKTRMHTHKRHITWILKETQKTSNKKKLNDFNSFEIKNMTKCTGYFQLEKLYV